MEDYDPLCILYAYLVHEQDICNPGKHLNDVGYYSGICCEAQYAKEMIKILKEDPKRAIEMGKEAGWLK